MEKPIFDTEFTHAHIYYEAPTREKAVRFQQKIAANFGGRVSVSRLVDRPIGPHPIPMFEVDLRTEILGELMPFLDREREGLSILLHPVSDEEVLDHTVRAKWLGEKLSLDVGFLEDFMAGKVGSVRTDLHKK